MCMWEGGYTYVLLPWQQDMEGLYFCDNCLLNTLKQASCWTQYKVCEFRVRERPHLYKTVRAVICRHVCYSQCTVYASVRIVHALVSLL